MIASATARSMAADAVAEAISGRKFIHDFLGEAAVARLSPRDAALANSIALGTMRRLLTIEHVLSRLARYDARRMTAPLRAITATAAYQAMCMDRIPVFAAVDEAVTLARQAVSKRAAGMVNALLRRLSEAIEARDAEWRPRVPHLIRNAWTSACAFTRPVLPPVEAAGPATGEVLSLHIAASTGERLERVRALVQRHGWAAAENVLWAQQATPPVVLHRHTLRIDAAEFAKLAAEAFGGAVGIAGGAVEAAGGAMEVAGAAVEVAGDAAFVRPSAFSAGNSLFRDGLAYVQDATAHSAAALLGVVPGERVLDLCAAPGGKSIALALMMGDQGRIVAVDASAERLARVTENVRRLGLSCVEVRAVNDALAGEFDAAIVDAPCSNSGVIARRPEARFRLRPEKLASLSRIQDELVRKAAAVVRVGGRMVYSTCSIEPEENERVVERFLADHSGWKCAHAQTTLPNWGRELSDWCDGGFAVLLRHDAASTNREK